MQLSHSRSGIIAFGYSEYKAETEKSDTQRTFYSGSSDIRNYHSHLYDELLIVKSGDIIAMTENTYLTHCGPCILYYRKNCPHTQLNWNDVRYERYCFGIDRHSVAELCPNVTQLSWQLQKGAFLLPLTAEELLPLSQISEIMLRVCEQPGDTEQRIRLLLAYLLSEVVRISENKSAPLAENWNSYLFDVVAYISTHIAEKITLEQLSHQFHIGKTKLTQDFNRFLSMTVTEYLIQERIQQAKTLLLQGNSVGEIAELCGFNDSSHFIRTFQKYIGVTPAKYRRQYADL